MNNLERLKNIAIDCKEVGTEFVVQNDKLNAYLNRVSSDVFVNPNQLTRQENSQKLGASTVNFLTELADILSRCEPPKVVARSAEKVSEAEVQKMLKKLAHSPGIYSV